MKNRRVIRTQSSGITAILFFFSSFASREAQTLFLALLPPASLSHRGSSSVAYAEEWWRGGGGDCVSVSELAKAISNGFLHHDALVRAAAQ